MTRTDSVVLGLGGVGSAALHHLAKRGVDCLGVEQFAVGHDRGSSHGESRAIRKAYFEHPAYVPLLRRAYELWDELAVDAGVPLLRRTGVLQVGPPGGVVVRGVRQAAVQHGLDVQTLGAGAVAERFPGFAVPPGDVALFESDAGWLDATACVRAHVDGATRRGAVVWEETGARGWVRDGADLLLSTDRGDVRCRRLLVAAGPWASRHLPLPTSVLRKTLHWFEAAAPDTPVWLYERPGGVFYGFPSVGGVLKAAEHSGGQAADPDAVDRRVGDADRAGLSAFLEAWRPDVGAPVRDRVCLYTMSTDGHFRMGQLPHEPAVRYVAGLSGHGFKFTAVLGELLAGEAPLVNPLI